MTGPAAVKDLTAHTEPGILFPLGQPVGLTYAFDLPASKEISGRRAADELRYVVRGGRTPSTLDEAQYRVWRLAHELDPLIGQPWTGASISGQLFAHGVPHGQETVDRLVEAELMAVVEDSDASIVSFASSVRVCPLFVGLGNSPEEPGIFHIGTGSITVASVTPLVYLLFSLAPQHRDLFETVVEMHLMAQESGLVDAITDNPIELLRSLLPALLQLLESDAIYLDLRSSGDT